MDTTHWPLYLGSLTSSPMDAVTPSKSTEDSSKKNGIPNLDIKAPPTIGYTILETPVSTLHEDKTSPSSSFLASSVKKASITGPQLEATIPMSRPKITIVSGAGHKA